MISALRRLYRQTTRWQKVTSWTINREPMWNSSDAQDRGPKDERWRQRHYVDAATLSLHKTRSKKGLRLDERIGCRRTSDAQCSRTTTHSRNALQAGVQPKTRAHLRAHTCISSTGAPLHSGTAKWSRVCAAIHAEGSDTEPLGHSLHSPGMRPEERGTPKAPRPADATPQAMRRG